MRGDESKYDGIVDQREKRLAKLAEDAFPIRVLDHKDPNAIERDAGRGRPSMHSMELSGCRISSAWVTLRLMTTAIAFPSTSATSRACT